MESQHNIIDGLRPLATPIDEIHQDPANARTGHDVERISTIRILTPTVLPPTMTTTKKLARRTSVDFTSCSPYGLSAKRAIKPLPPFLRLVVALLGAEGILRLSYEALTAVFAGLRQPATGSLVCMFRATGFATTAFGASLFHSAIDAVGMFRMSLITVALSMTVNAKGAPVAGLIPQFGIIGPWFYVICLQIHTALTTVLTGVIVALEDGHAPRFVLVSALLYLAAFFVSLVSGVRLSLLEVGSLLPKRVIGSPLYSLHNSLALGRVLPRLFGFLALRFSLSWGGVATFSTTVFLAACRWVDLEFLTAMLARQFNHSVHYSIMPSMDHI